MPPPPSTLLALAAVGAFISTALLAGAAAYLYLFSVSAGRRRLFAGARSEESLSPELMPLTIRRASPFWAPIARLMPRSQKEMERLRQRLLRAGIRFGGAAIVYTAVETVGPVALGLVPFLFVQGVPALIAALVGAGAAFLGPGLYVGSRVTARKREIEDGLPDALDLLVVCIEAGSGIDQALVKTSEQLAIAYPALAEELRAVTIEVRAGKPRIEAFKNLAQRTKVDDVRGLVAMLVQTDRFGTSIGQALRTHSEVSRGKRRQRAEEAAQKIGVKLVFPLVLCFFPAFYVVVLGPAIVQFVREFMR